MSFSKSFIKEGGGGNSGGGGGTGEFVGSKLITINRALGAITSNFASIGITINISNNLTLINRFLGQKLFVISDLSMPSEWSLNMNGSSAARNLNQRGAVMLNYTNTLNSGKRSILFPEVGESSYNIARVPTRLPQTLSYIDYNNTNNSKCFSLGKEHTFTNLNSGNIILGSSSLDLLLTLRSPVNSGDNFAPHVYINLFVAWSNATIAANPSVPWNDIDAMKALISEVQDGIGIYNEPGASGIGLTGVQPDIFLWGKGEDPLKNDADGTDIIITSNDFATNLIVAKNVGVNTAGKEYEVPV